MKDEQTSTFGDSAADAYRGGNCYDHRESSCTVPTSLRKYKVLMRFDIPCALLKLKSMMILLNLGFENGNTYSNPITLLPPPDSKSASYVHSKNSAWSSCSLHRSLLVEGHVGEWIASSFSGNLPRVPSIHATAFSTFVLL